MSSREPLLHSSWELRPDMNAIIIMIMPAAISVRAVGMSLAQEVLGFRCLPPAFQSVRPELPVHIRDLSQMGDFRRMDLSCTRNIPKCVPYLSF